MRKPSKARAGGRPCRIKSGARAGRPEADLCRQGRIDGFRAVPPAGSSGRKLLRPGRIEGDSPGVKVEGTAVSWSESRANGLGVGERAASSDERRGVGAERRETRTNEGLGARRGRIGKRTCSGGRERMRAIPAPRMTFPILGRGEVAKAFARRPLTVPPWGGLRAFRPFRS